MRKIYKIFSIVLTVALLVSCFSAVSVSAKKYTVSKFVDIEASDIEIKGGTYELKDDGTLYNKGNTNRPATGEEGELSFSFTVKNDGKYIIWGLVKPNTTTKAMFISVNGGEYTEVGLSNNISSFSYVKFHEGEYKAGDEVNVELATANGWFYIDKFTVAKDDYKLENPDGTPAGTVLSIIDAIPYSDNIPSFKVKGDGLYISAADTAYVSLWQNKTTPEGNPALYINAGTYDNPGKGHRGFIEFDFTVDEPGDYTIWMYNMPTSTSKSAWITNKDGEFFTVGLGGTADYYGWTRMVTYEDVAKNKTMSFKLTPNVTYYTVAGFCVVKGTKAVPVGENGEINVSGPVFDEKVIYPTPPVLPEEGVHPRVYFTKEDIPQIKANMELEENKTAVERHLNNLTKDTDGKLAPPESGKATNYKAAPLGVIESYAFEYAINGNKEYGEKAVAAMSNYVDTVVFDVTNGNAYNDWGQVEYTIGLVYDWCNDLLTDEVKVKFRDAVVEYTAAKVGYPPSGKTVTGHATEGPVLRDLLVPAIAMYDDFPSIYLNAAGMICSQYAPVKQFLYPGHAGSLQGDHYTYYRDTWAVSTLWLMDQLGLPNVFGEDQEFETYWYLYARRPDGATLRDGDTHQGNTVVPSYLTYTRLEMYLANYYDNPYLKWEYLRQKNLEGALSEIANNFAIDCVERIIINDGKVKATPVYDLPLSKYFDTPKGAYIARTGWEDGVDAPVVVAEMKVDEYWASNHDHLDSGAFQIYYKGPLATDAGYYQASFTGEGESNYNSSHWKNYSTRTIAHNSLLIKDPNEKVPSNHVADGGQKVVNDRIEIKDLNELQNSFKVAEVLAHEHGPDTYTPDYTYLKGDLTDAYSDKVTGVERSFMFLNLKDSATPAAMIVFDKVDSSNESFEKSFVLNTAVTPEISGTRTVVKNTLALDDINAYNGKLTMDTLMPAADNVKITAYNGMDKYSYAGNTKIYATAPDNTEPGGSRIEVSPVKPAKTDYFLNVMQVGDADGAEALPATLIETDAYAGAIVADKVVMFSKQSGRTEGNVAFSFAGEGEYQIMVADLKAGTWNVTKDGAQIASVVATEDGGVVSFNGTAGAYTLSYANANATRVDNSVKPANKDYIGIRVNKQFIYTDVDPVIENGRTLVPMRAIFEAIGAEVTWDQATSTATGIRAGKEIKITNNQQTAYVNGKPVELDVPAQIRDGRFLVPIRFISENLGCTVRWDGDARIVSITYIKVSNQSRRPNQVDYIEVIQSGDDGNGNSIEQAVDGYIETRWAPAGSDFKSAWGIFDIGEVKKLDKLYLAYLYGSSRVYKFAIEVSVDGVNYTEVLRTQSSGKTDDFEEFDLGGVEARYVRYLGGGNSTNDFNSVGEMQITEKK